MPRDIMPPDGYAELLKAVKERIRGAQTRAALAVNRELVLLYWSIGRDIVARQEEQRWGTAVIEVLAKDLRAAFPGVEGFSARNLWRMRAFYLAYRPENAFLPQPVAEIGLAPSEPLADLPQGHNIILMEKVKDAVQREWYAWKAIEHGWSRNILVHQIERDLYGRQGKALTNFERTLPAPQSDLAQQILKNPYNFDFLTLGEDARERDLERGLLEHLRAFLLELGVGFAFVGSQYHLAVGDQDFYIDLLFYHLRLRHPEDAPTMGLLLCKTKNRVAAEYALRDASKLIGVAEYQITEALPGNIKGSLPTVKQLEAEFSPA